MVQSMRKIKYLFAYQALSALAGLGGWPWFYWHLKSRGRGESFLPRLGLRLPAEGPPPGTPRLWIHGVSVGEILAAVPLVRQIQHFLPQAGFIISTGTETGQAVARREFLPLGVRVCYFPLDLPWAVRRYLEHLRPHLFICLESEIWPNFLATAAGRGVRLALLNARLSERAFARLRRYKRYVFDVIDLFEVIAAGSSQDYERLISLGLKSQKLHLTGNLKVDGLVQKVAEIRQERPETGGQGSALPLWLSAFLEALTALQDQPIFLAASTHPGEEAVILDAYERLRVPYPTLMLLLAPRHPERAPDIGRLLQERGLSYHLWHRLKSGEEARTLPVVVIDTIGDLLGLYGIATVAFVGGSLVPHGGQNILEAAVWGTAPLYGPHLHNFRWAEAILEDARAGILVRDAASLAAAVRQLLDQPEMRRRMGKQARLALLSHQGAARRQAELIVKLLSGDRRGK